MNNLIEKYKYFKLNHEDYYLLGPSTPTNTFNVDSDLDIINNFLYTYSFLGLSATDIYSFEHLRAYLEKKFNSIRNIKNLTFEQKWWSLAVIYLQIGADYHQFNFFSSICESLLDSIQTLDKDELNFYCNSINDSLSSLIGYDLRIRPHTDKVNQIEQSNLYSNLVLNHKAILKIFKDHIPQNNVINKDTYREIELLNKIGLTYDTWSIIFDIFVGQIISQMNSDIPFDCSNEKDALRNSIELSILNISEDSDFMPKEISTVSELISNLILTE